jgi:hypothetical protein
MPVKILMGNDQCNSGYVSVYNGIVSEIRTYAGDHKEERVEHWPVPVIVVFTGGNGISPLAFPHHP